MGSQFTKRVGPVVHMYFANIFFSSFLICTGFLPQNLQLQMSSFLKRIIYFKCVSIGKSNNTKLQLAIALSILLLIMPVCVQCKQPLYFNQLCKSF